MSFTFTGFKAKLYALMLANEASKNGDIPYTLSWAKTANSGWSFGHIQFDLSTNDDGRNLFLDILANAKDSSGNYIARDNDPAMQVVAEVNQGRRTVLEYLLSLVSKTVQEAGREK